MKAIKILFFGLAGLVVLALVGLGAALVIVDGQFVKARLERAMKEKNRTLKIEGEPQLKLFPVAGIALGKTTLSEPGSDKLVRLARFGRGRGARDAAAVAARSRSRR